MTPIERTDEEMQITLQRLAYVFGVDTTPAQGLAGAELAAWLDSAEDKVFYRELAELQAGLAAQKTKEGVNHGS